MHERDLMRRKYQQICRKLATSWGTALCLEYLNCVVHPEAKIDQLETVRLVWPHAWSRLQGCDTSWRAPHRKSEPRTQHYGVAATSNSTNKLRQPNSFSSPKQASTSQLKFADTNRRSNSTRHLETCESRVRKADEAAINTESWRTNSAKHLYPTSHSLDHCLLSLHVEHTHCPYQYHTAMIQRSKRLRLRFSRTSKQNAHRRATNRCMTTSVHNNRILKFPYRIANQAHHKAQYEFPIETNPSSSP